MRSTASTMAVTAFVAPTRAVAPADDVWPTNLIANHPTDDGAHRARDDGTHARANAYPFHLACIGLKWRRPKCCGERCNFPDGAHGEPFAIGWSDNPRLHNAALEVPVPANGSKHGRCCVWRAHARPVPSWGGGPDATQGIHP